jgi:hypothetical protein
MGMWKKQRTLSFTKSLFFHFRVLFCQGAGLKRGQQPVSVIFFGKLITKKENARLKFKFLSLGGPSGGREKGCLMKAYGGREINN